MNHIRRTKLQERIVSDIKTAWLSKNGRYPETQPLTKSENSVIEQVIDATGCVRKILALAEINDRTGSLDGKSADALIASIEHLGLIPNGGKLTITPNSPVDVLIGGRMAQLRTSKGGSKSSAARPSVGLSATSVL